MTDASKLEIKNKLSKDILSFYFLETKAGLRNGQGDSLKMDQLFEDTLFLLGSEDLRIQAVETASLDTVEDAEADLVSLLVSRFFSSVL